MVRTKILSNRYATIAFINEGYESKFTHAYHQSGNNRNAAKDENEKLLK